MSEKEITQGIEPAQPSADQQRRKLLDQYMSSQAAAKERGKDAAIGPRPQGKPAPMSFSQQQVWLHGQMAGDIPLYNQTLTVYRRGSLDAAVL